MDEKTGNIIIADESALFFHLHSDAAHKLGAVPTLVNPLEACATTASDYKSFNPSHPLYGGMPVSVLVSRAADRRQSRTIRSRCCSDELPSGSFWKLREGLYIATPELIFARMGNFVSDAKLAEIGMNLCSRYYIDHRTDAIEDRSVFATTPEQLKRYLEKASDLKGSKKALKSLRWVLGNSGSPMETIMKLQFCNPLWSGGLSLPFTHMNYNVSAGRLSRMAEQSIYCIDMVDLLTHTGLEFDGVESHQDVSKDKRRRNALRALNWEVFAIDKTVLFNPDATINAGLQIARHMGIRIQFPKNWEKAFVRLRTDLGLPT